jgi:H+/Cl- antiporter ClcA
MKLHGFASVRDFWLHFGWGTISGLVGAVAAFMYVAVMAIGMKHLWPEPHPVELFSGSWRTVVIMTVAGLIVGLLHHWRVAEEINVFEAIPKGTMELQVVPGAIINSLVTLIGGFSLGPEVPTGMLGGGLAVWLTERRRLPDSFKKINLMSGVSGAYAGLFTAPFGVFLMLLELAHTQSVMYYGTLVIGATAALLGFTVFYTATGDRFADVLRILDLPPYQLEIWHIAIAILLGLLGVVTALLFAVTSRNLKRLVAPLQNTPVIRCTLAGFLLGLLAKVMPLTLFLGTEGLVEVTKNGTQLGIGFLLFAALTKLLATSGALATGFIGGPIFPLFFVGGTIGEIISLLFPWIPVKLAVGCVMAAVPAALIPVPIALAVITALITSIRVEEIIPVAVAALTAYFVLNGLILPDPTTSSQPPTPEVKHHA